MADKAQASSAARPSRADPAVEVARLKASIAAAVLRGALVSAEVLAGAALGVEEEADPQEAAVEERAEAEEVEVEEGAGNCGVGKFWVSGFRFNSKLGTRNPKLVTVQHTSV